jgi:hypothetical protein
MRRLLVIVTRPRSLLNVLVYEENFILFFISVDQIMDVVENVSEDYPYDTLLAYCPSGTECDVPVYVFVF